MGLYIVGLAIVMGFAALLWRQYKSGAGWQRHEASFFVDLIAMGVTALLVGTLVLVQLQSPPRPLAEVEAATATPTITQRATARATTEVTLTDSVETPTIEASAELTSSAGLTVTATLTAIATIEATSSISSTPEATATPPTATAQQYTVAQGDTMIDIALKFGVSVEEIQAANPGLDVDSLQIDQVITIPAPAPSGAPAPTAAPATSVPAAPTRGTVRYTIREGDTLSGIAKRFGVTSQQIIAATPGLNADRLSIGQVINIPNQPLP